MLLQVERLGPQDLASRKRKKLTCQTLPAFGSLHDRGSTPARCIALCCVVQHRRIAANHSQEIVEIVRNASGKLPDSLHSLGLAQRRFGLLSLSDLDFEAPVDVCQIVGALVHYHLDAPGVSGAKQQQCPQKAGAEDTNHKNSPALPTSVLCKV